MEPHPLRERHLPALQKRRRVARLIRPRRDYLVTFFGGPSSRAQADGLLGTNPHPITGSLVGAPERVTVAAVRAFDDMGLRGHLIDWESVNWYAVQGW